MSDGGDPSVLITNHITRILLRYFRNAERAGAAGSRADAQRDLELLRLHWSISPKIQKLTEHILRHRHETQSFLTLRVRSDDGPIRGRLDARATSIQRMVAGHAAVTVSYEAVRSFASGPNHALTWVLQHAWLLSGRFLALLPHDASYRPIVERSAAGLDQTRKIEAIRRATADISLARRPSAGALQEAARSRRRVYRLAYEAYLCLAALEAGDAAVIHEVLHDTLLTPIEVWRRFELAVGLDLARALEATGAGQMELNVLAGDSRTPIARVGRFSVFWQTRTPHYQAPQLEPSEIIDRQVLAGYGLGPDIDRPDLIVTDDKAGTVVAVVEVKFFAAAGEDAWDRLRDAAHQVVRYSRGYRDLPEIAELLTHSVIALVRRPSFAAPLAAEQPLVVDFAEMQADGLHAWARAIQQR